MTAAEHADKASDLLAKVAYRAEQAETFASIDPATARGYLDSIPTLIALAQVHATLATIPDPLEAALWPSVPESISGVLTPAGGVGVGSRVVLLVHVEKDTLGTVVAPVDDDEARDPIWSVRFDDGHTVALSEQGLAVVFGA